MKKSIIIGILLGSCNVMSGEFSITALYDTNVEEMGTRISVMGNQFQNVSPVFSFTSVPHEYNRFSLGGEASLMKFDNINVVANSALTYQDEKDLTGLTFGLGIINEVQPNASIKFGVEHFSSFSNSQFDGASLNMGVSVKF